MERSRPYVDYTIRPDEMEGLRDHLNRFGYQLKPTGSSEIVYQGEEELSRVSKQRGKSEKVMRVQENSHLDEVMKGFLFSCNVRDAESGRNPNILLCAGTDLKNMTIERRRPGLNLTSRSLEY